MDLIGATAADSQPLSPDAISSSLESSDEGRGRDESEDEDESDS